MDKESIEFHFTQSKNDTSVLTAVASQIYNPLRVIIWCVFACGLFLCMLLTLSGENSRYTAPILILSFLLTVAAFSMLAIIFFIRPKLLKCIQNNSQTSICIRCTQENIEICRENTLPVRVEYKNVLSQFWCVITIFCTFVSVETRFIAMNFFLFLFQNLPLMTFTRSHLCWKRKKHVYSA